MKGRGQFCSRSCSNKSKVGIKGLHWSGDNVGYHGIHLWLKKYFGKIIKCDKCGFDKMPEGKKRYFEWALIKGRRYERKRNNFWRLCISCHRKYDYTEEKRQIFIKRLIGNNFRKNSVL